MLGTTCRAVTIAMKRDEYIADKRSPANSLMIDKADALAAIVLAASAWAVSRGRIVLANHPAAS